MPTKLAPLVRFTSKHDQQPTLADAALCGCGHCLECRIAKFIARVDRIESNPNCIGYLIGSWKATWPTTPLKGA